MGQLDVGNRDVRGNPRDLLDAFSPKRLGNPLNQRLREAGNAPCIPKECRLGKFEEGNDIPIQLEMTAHRRGTLRKLGGSSKICRPNKFWF